MPSCPSPSITHARGRQCYLLATTHRLCRSVDLRAGHRRDVQHRTAARNLLARVKHLCPSVRHRWADSGYTGTLIDWARDLFGISIEVVAKLAGQVGFVVLHGRWVVERSLAWINQHRRCVRDYERRPEHHEAIVRWAAIHTISRRLAR